MAEYILEKTHNIHVKSVLYISNSPYPDYLRCLTLIGFKEIFGKNCHDYIKIPHIYKADINYSELYGKGMTYTNILDSDYRNNSNDNTIENDIYNHKYDLIIFGSLLRGNPYLNEVLKYYKANEIIYLIGEDEIITPKNEWYSDEHPYVFIREL